MLDREDKGMTLIVKTVTRITLGFILLYGIYIGFSGHASPGGGFAGGVIIALSFVHIMLAFGKDVALRHLKARMLRVLSALGGLVFLFVILMGFAHKRVPLDMIFDAVRSCHIFTNDIIIPLCEMVIVGAGLFAIFTALVLLSKIDKNSE